VISIQVAVDSVPLERINELSPLLGSLRPIDLVEIGTPMITHYGVSYFDALTACIDRSRIYVDLKVCDFVADHLKPYLDRGARHFSAQFGMNEDNMEALAQLAERDGFNVYFSSMCYPLNYLKEQAAKIWSHGFRYFIAHGQGVTRASAFEDMQHRLQELAKLPELQLIAGGGIGRDNIKRMEKYHITGVIVGRGIMAEPDPRVAYEALKNAI
jgi:3-keto-L-gulonate-6-phosphate decarboxylase